MRAGSCIRRQVDHQVAKLHRPRRCARWASRARRPAASQGAANRSTGAAPRARHRASCPPRSLRQQVHDPALVPACRPGAGVGWAVPIWAANRSCSATVVRRLSRSARRCAGGPAAPGAGVQRVVAQHAGPAPSARPSGRRAAPPAGRARRRRSSRGCPRCAVVTTGTPIAMASASTLGKPSRSPSSITWQGRAKTAGPGRRAPRSSSWVIAPTAGCTMFGQAELLGRCRRRTSCARHGRARRRSGSERRMPRSRSSAQASTSWSKPFFSTKRPTARISGTAPGVRGRAGGRWVQTSRCPGRGRWRALPRAAGGARAARSRWHRCRWPRSGRRAACVRAASPGFRSAW